MVVQKTSNTPSRACLAHLEWLGQWGVLSLSLQTPSTSCKAADPYTIHADHRLKKSTDTSPAKAAGYSSLFLSRHVGCQNVGALIL